MAPVLVTFSILTWIFLFIGIFFYLFLFFYLFNPKLLKSCPSISYCSPLILAPAVIYVFHTIFHINLIDLPLQDSKGRVFLYFSIPAAILFFACGLYSQLKHNLLVELKNLENTNFMRFTKSLNLNQFKSCHKLLFLRVFSHSYTLNINLLFSELIIIEVLFNCAGLGFASWQHARLLEFQKLIFSMIPLLVCYYSLISIFTIIHQFYLEARVE